MELKTSLSGQKYVGEMIDSGEIESVSTYNKQGSNESDALSADEVIGRNGGYVMKKVKCLLLIVSIAYG